MYFDLGGGGVQRHFDFGGGGQLDCILIWGGRHLILIGRGWGAKEHTFFAAGIDHFVNNVRLGAFLRNVLFLHKYSLK